MSELTATSSILRREHVGYWPHIPNINIITIMAIDTLILSKFRATTADGSPRPPPPPAPLLSPPPCPSEPPCDGDVVLAGGTRWALLAGSWKLTSPAKGTLVSMMTT